jgi:hypothetical protein
MKEQILLILVSAASGAIMSSVAIFVPRWFKRNVALPSRIDKLFRGFQCILGVNQKQNQAIALGIAVNQTILEVIRDGKVNGNIKVAIRQNSEAEQVTNCADEMTKKFLIEELGGKEA